MDNRVSRNDRRRNTGPGFNRLVDRMVSAKINTLHLNHAPKWLRVRGINRDPPVYSQTTPVSRKIRFVGRTSTTTDITLSASELAGAFSSGSVASITLDRVKCFGPAGLNRLVLSTNFNLDTSSNFEVFDDFGTTGASRPMIDIVFPRTGLQNIDSTDIQVLNITLLDAANARVAGEFILDLWVTADWNIPTKVLT